MTDEDTKEEERLLRMISRKNPQPGGKSRPVSMAVNTSIRSPPDIVTPSPVPAAQQSLASPPQITNSVTPRGTSSTAQAPTTNNTAKDIPSRSVSTPSAAYVPRASAPPQFISSSTNVGASHPVDIEQLKEKKRTLLGTVVSARRDLEEVRAEIAKLKQKETELIALMEKREHAVQQLTQEIEHLELSAQHDKLTLEEHKKRIEEEKARKVREENERRRKEEAEEERKKKETEEEKRRKMVVNASNYVGYDVKSSPPHPTTAPISDTHNDMSMLRPVSSSDIRGEDLEVEEEARLMRAMSRNKATAHTNIRGSSYTKPVQVPTAAPTATQKPAAAEPHWKEHERAKEIERNQRIVEENRKKEDAKRVEQERLAQSKLEETTHLTTLQNREGVSHTFFTPAVYTVSDVFICGDFTDWKEVQVDTDAQPKNFQYSITLPVTKGVHFYRFRVGDKWEVNKNSPTGVSPHGDVMNKVEI